MEVNVAQQGMKVSFTGGSFITAGRLKNLSRKVKIS